MELFHMSNMVNFWLSDGALTGTIPSKAFGQYMTNLESIDRTGSTLRGSLPTQVGLLTKLTMLQVRLNQFDGSIPTHIGRLLELNELDVQGNALTGTIPSEIGGVTLLRKLYVEENILGGRLPSEIGLLTNLIDLSFFDNHFQDTVPKEYTNLKQLQVLYVENNDLTGSVNGIFCGSSEQQPALLPNIEDMWADCRGGPPKLRCSCCTTCCNPKGINCVERI